MKTGQIYYCSILPYPDGVVLEPDMSAGFCPDHKAAMVLFLDRVYGVQDQNFLLHLLEVGFLPDLRAAASLDTVSLSPLVCVLCLIFSILSEFFRNCVAHNVLARLQSISKMV